MIEMIFCFCVFLHLINPTHTHISEERLPARGRQKKKSLTGKKVLPRGQVSEIEERKTLQKVTSECEEEGRAKV